MEDVTEVIVEPEPGEEEPTLAEAVESSGEDCPEASPAEGEHPERRGDSPEPGSQSPCEAEGQHGSIGRSRRSVAFFAVFDGHGGREAAHFARDYLWELLKKQRGFWSDCDREVCSAIRKGFVACHHAMWKKLRESSSPVWDGSVSQVMVGLSGQCLATELLFGFWRCCRVFTSDSGAGIQPWWHLVAGAAKGELRNLSKVPAQGQSR